ncbi:type II secretion system protein [Acinetobacter sp. ANC 4648]|uniref:type II secretion system protein n=1 Tax=Acinetobacter sp. ANC 4648 TaxID=1977875 RepID=UPI000A337942|nr:type II secretion system protein [Acinetobacter sp. ANC 4648]OTG82999.1 type II secretion system protein GspH [Acinetobacter sp. ANC 4648]
MNHPSPSLQRGFTLIELMVVIVIVSIMASLVVLNVGGVDHRKAMQAREFLILDLKKMNREANDQARIYALDTHPATDVAAFNYQLTEYKPNSVDLNSRIQVIEQNKWQALTEFKPRILPEHVSFMIQVQDHQYQNANNADLVGNQAPQLIWFGNGEVKPVSIQMYYDQKPIGAPINIDYLGKITDAE